MSEINHGSSQDKPHGDMVRGLWLHDRQKSSPRPLAEWVIEHEQLREEIIWWELAYRRGGPDGVMELAELEAIIEQPIDVAALRALNGSAAVAEPQHLSLLKAMESAAIKPADVAKKLQVGTTVIARLLKGQVDPLTAPVSFLISFAQAINTKLDVLIDLLSAPQLKTQTAMYKRDPRGQQLNKSLGVAASTDKPQPLEAKPNGDTAARLSFKEAVDKAPDMTAEEKQVWLTEAHGDDRD